jgi:uncharacterized protein (TIRG00374 family)
MKQLSFRAWMSIVTIVLIAVVLFFSRHEIARAWELTAGVNLAILALVIPAVMIGYIAAGEMVFSYLRQKKQVQNISIWQQMRISLELNFVNHILPSGGVSGISYMNWRLGKFGVKTGKATMAQAVRYVTGFGALSVLLMVSVLLVTMDGTVNRWIILMSSALVSVMIGITIATVYLLKSMKRMRTFANIVARAVNAVVSKVTLGKTSRVISAVKIEQFLKELHEDYVELSKDKRVLIQPFLWGIFFTIMEIAIFWIVFWALGSPVNPAPILIAYGLASLAGFIVVTPGGAGAYEAIMVLVLSIAGMTSGQALAGIVLARAIVLFVTIVGGYAFYQLSLVKYGKRSVSDI